jgi:plastocyanin
MKRFFRLGIFFALLTALMVPSGAFARGLQADPPSQTYTVLVGYENIHKAFDVMGFFPNAVTIHVGDTVHWKINSTELHTVTFLAGGQIPELLVPSALVQGADPTVSPLLINPEASNPAIPSGGLYDGTTYANSGIMGRESWETQTFDLTFTKAGTYDYLCVVHGVMMSGKVVVEGTDVNVPSPAQEMAMGQRQIAKQLARVPAVQKKANAQIVPDVKNQDGSTTHTILLGYSDGQIDLMQFFPSKVNVRQGDTVVWEMSPKNEAPHTVTFLNGAASPDLATVVPPFIYINQATLFPYQPGPELTRTGVYNSGVAQPIPGQFYSLKIGAMTPGLQPFVCLLHDESGMKGALMVTP